MRLIIRTDASESSDFGTGHVQRMTLFAENIKNYGNIFFLMRSKNQFSVSKTIQTKFKVVKINSDRDLEQNTKEELFSILKLKPDIVFFDRLNTKYNLIHILKKKNVKVVSFDDSGLGSKLTNLTFNSLVSSKLEEANILNGYKYLILNKNIKNKKIRKNQIFISFGGFDKKKLCQKMLQKIDFSKFNNYKFILVCGSNSYKQQLEKFIKITEINNVKILARTDNFLETLSNSKLSITAGGITLFESIRLKIPSLCYPQFHHQIRNINQLEDLGLTIKIRMNQCLTKQILKTLNQLNHKKNNIIDGLGVDRVVKELKQRKILWT